MDSQVLADVYRSALDNIPDSVQIKDVSGAVVYRNAAFFETNKDPYRPTFPQLFKNFSLPHGFELEVEKTQCSDIIKLALDAMPDMVWIAEPDGSVDFFSDTYSHFSGVSSDEMHGQGWHAFIHPEDVEKAKQAWAHSLATTTPYYIEYRIRSADGSYKWFIGRGRPLYDARGRVLKWFGTCTNIDEHKRIQEDLRKAKAELSEERRLFQSMLDHLPVSIVFARAPTGELFYNNFKFAQMWGGNCQEAHSIGDYVSSKYFTALHKDGSLYQPQDWPLARSIMYGDVVEGEDTTVRYADGRNATIRLSSAPVYDDKGSMIAALAFSEDVTERIKMEESRTELMAREQAALEASRLKSEFLARMSHELRTPMHHVLGTADALKDDPKLTEKQRKLVETIKESGKLLLLVINDILDFSKVEAGKLQLEETTVDLRFIFEHFDLITRPTACKRGIELITEISPDLPQALIGDPGRIQQIVYNLSSNALKFTSHGYVSVKVDGNPKADDKYEVRFSVSDTGIGISPEKMSRLFQPFMQADTSTTRKYGGTGLGLAICKSLVDLMGGSISVQSEEGRGTTFYVNLTLPIGHVPLPECPSTKHDAEILKNINILIVEDNLINQKITAQALKKMGATHIDIAFNGEVAIEKFQENHYDVILMDIQMPVMDGYRATKKIRDLEECNHLSRTPIIALTAGALKVDQDACFEAGMDDHISKPFGQEELCGRILSQVTKVHPQCPSTASTSHTDSSFAVCKKD